MLSEKELLELRKYAKAKKPHFIRQDSHKKSRLGKKWRRPKGLHSKIRLKLRGRGKRISQGYRSPKKVRYLHKSGLNSSLIKSIRDLESLDAQKNCLVISSSLGEKKKVVVLKKCQELGFIILNVNNPEQYIKKIEDKISSKKKLKEDKKKKEKDEKKDAKEGKKDGKLAVKTEEEGKKEIEKKEKDKVLTKRN